MSKLDATEGVWQMQVQPVSTDDDKPHAAPAALRPTSPSRGTNATSNANAKVEWNSFDQHHLRVATSMINEPAGHLAEKETENLVGVLPCATKSTQYQKTQQADVDTGRGDVRSLARDITAFSPYAARLGATPSLEDEVASAVIRLESLRFDGGFEETEGIEKGGIDSVEMMAQNHHEGNKGCGSPLKAVVARKMCFFQENEQPDKSPEMKVTVPQPERALLDPVKLEESPPPSSSVGFPVSVGGMQHEGDVREESPPFAERRTLVVFPSACLLHMGSDESCNHQETPKRLELLCGEQGALRRKAFQGLEWANPAELKPAVITDLLRVHEYDYLLHIEERCKGAPSVIPSRPATFNGDIAEKENENGSNNDNGDRSGGIDVASYKTATTTVSSTLDSRHFGDRFRPDVGYVDVDTRVSRESFDAARMAAGAVMSAVDRVVQGKNPNAFVAVRPPGHHAGPSGSSPSASFWKNPGMNSSGFCLINNTAIGAAYARCRYGRTGQISRVAIVDIDIHHGNGTEEIVRCLRPMTTRLPLPPSWPPAYKTVYKPWLDDRDADNVFFGSVSLQDKDSFYPASGTEEEKFEGNGNIVNVSLSALGPTPGEETKKRALTKTKMTEYVNKAGAEFKAKCTKTLLSRLKRFSPDLLIVSAGFDGHVEDYYHYLSNEIFEWITLELEECVPSGRVVSVLEGGYSLHPRVSRAKAAQQARANAKRTSKSESTAEVCGSSVTGVTPGQSLRGRRSRPATRGSTQSSSCPSSSATTVATAATVVTAASSAKTRPTPVTLTSVPSSSTHVVENGVHAPQVGGGSSSSSAVRGSEISDGIASSAAVSAGFGTGENYAVGVLLPTVVPKESRQRPRDDYPLALGVGNPLEADTEVGMMGARMAAKVQEKEYGVGEEKLPLLRPEDGGLVRGVVSHVKALVAASGRRTRRKVAP